MGFRRAERTAHSCIGFQEGQGLGVLAQIETGEVVELFVG